MISFSADLVFDGFRFLPEGSSVEVNNSGEIISLNNGTTYERKHLKGLLMPGMVNAHCHLELSHLKGKIPKHTGLVGFLRKVVSERGTMDESHIQLAITQAEEEMWRNGMVAVGDICNTNHTEQIKKTKRLRYHSFIELIGLNPTKALPILEQGVLLKEKLEPASLGLHAPYSITPELLQLTDEMNRDQILTMHLQESEEETKLFHHAPSAFLSFLEQITGHPYHHWSKPMSSCEAVLQHLHHAGPLLFVHNCVTSEHDLNILAHHKQSVFLCACPGANVYIENRLPDVRTWLAKKLPLVLGTDSLASNDELNLVHEMMLLHDQFPEVPMTEWLHAATHQGACALGMQKEIGSFEIGQSPGIIQIENWDSLLIGEEKKAVIIRQN